MCVLQSTVFSNAQQETVLIAALFSKIRDIGAAIGVTAADVDALSRVYGIK